MDEMTIDELTRAVVVAVTDATEPMGALLDRVMTIVEVLTRRLDVLELEGCIGDPLRQPTKKPSGPP
jgi:hypothetical protein